MTDLAKSNTLSPDELKEVIDSFYNEKQRRFCEEYILDFNGAQAAIRAGYSERGAKVRASKLLTKDNVQRYLAHLKATQTLKTGVTAEQVIEELCKIAFMNPLDLYNVQEDGSLTFKPLDEIKHPEIIAGLDIKALKDKDGVAYGELQKLKLWDKKGALELLGKHFALFTENVNLTNNGEKFEEPKNVTKVFINHRAKGEPIADDDNE